MKRIGLNLFIMLTLTVLSGTARAQATFEEPSSFEYTFYVNPSHPSASDANEGTSPDLPFAGLAYACTHISDNLNWVTGANIKVVAWPGVYRENVKIFSKASTFVLEKAPGTEGHVVISGADIYDGWTAQGGHWVHTWSYDWGTTYKPPAPPSGVYPAGYDSAFPGVYQRRELVLVNGEWMEPVNTLGELTEGTFFVDETANLMHLQPPAGTDMGSALIEVPVRTVDEYANRDNSTILNVIVKGNLLMRGIAVRHSASMFMTFGAIVHWTTGQVRIEDCDFSYNGGVGLTLSGTNNATLSNVTANFNGERGMGVGPNNGDGGFVENILFENCEWSGNNWRYRESDYVGFWDAAGIKLVPRTRNVHMRNCQALDNFSDGIWFDWHNYEATIEGCVMENNARAGLTLEASTHDELDGVPVRTALVTGCRIQNNESGIYSYGSRNVHIDGCVISNNCGEYGGQISVGGDSRVVYNEPQISTGWRIHNSAIYATEPTQQLVRFWTYGGLQTSPSYDWYTTVESDSNQWFHPGRTDAFPDPDAAMIGVSLTLEQWRTQTGNDLHSTWGVPDTATGFAPTATFTGSCSGGGIPRTVSLDASSSFDANGTLVDYAWQFGDGTTGSGVTCTHTFDYANRYEIALTVTDNEGLTHTVRNLLPIDELAAANGSVLLERWLDAPGGAISDIPLDRAPDESVLHTSLSFSTSSEDNYATRISGYLFPPQTGAYTFWITSDDQSELWLSPNDNALQKQRLSYVPEWAQGGEYTKYPSQRSEQVELTAGTKYYFEILHKEGGWGDHVSVQWTRPGASSPEDIASEYLAGMLYDNNGATVKRATIGHPNTGQPAQPVTLFDLRGRHITTVTRTRRIDGVANGAYVSRTQKGHVRRTLLQLQ